MYWAFFPELSVEQLNNSIMKLILMLSQSHSTVFLAVMQKEKALFTPVAQFLLKPAHTGDTNCEYIARFCNNHRQKVSLLPLAAHVVGARWEMQQKLIQFKHDFPYLNILRQSRLLTSFLLKENTTAAPLPQTLISPLGRARTAISSNGKYSPATSSTH